MRSLVNRKMKKTRLEKEQKSSLIAIFTLKDKLFERSIKVCFATLIWGGGGQSNKTIIKQFRQPSSNHHCSDAVCWWTSVEYGWKRLYIDFTKNSAHRAITNWYFQLMPSICAYQRQFGIAPRDLLANGMVVIALSLKHNQHFSLWTFIDNVNNRTTPLQLIHK